MKAFFLTKRDLTDAGSRCRVYQYAPYLESRGIACTVAPRDGPADRPLARLLAARRSDVVMIQKRLFPRSALRGLRLANPRLIYDFDDALWIDRSLCDGARDAISRMRLDAVLRASRVVIAGNGFLADYARPFAREVLVIPTPVDTERLRPASPRPVGERVAIGWIGTSGNFAYFDHIADILRKLLRDRPEVELRIVCDKPLDLPGLRSTFVRWDLNTEVAELQRLEIGIMPVPDNPHTRGKCGLKALEYMAAGVAVLCSPVGINAEIVRDGENGLLAATPRGWLEALHALIDRPSLRAKLAAAGRRTVVESYSLAVWAPRFEETLRRVAQPQGRR